MSNIVKNPEVAEVIERALIEGDLKPLTPAQRVVHYNRVCESMLLNPVTRPFDYILYQNKLVLYPNKNCAEQLRRIHGVSIKIVSRDKMESIYSIIVQAKDKLGREDESTAYLDLSGLAGLALSNALMKCETKAKRRVTLSICGLGMTDESEWEDVENCFPVAYDFDDPQTIQTNVKKAEENIPKSIAEKEVKKELSKRTTPCSLAHKEEIKNLLQKHNLKLSDLVEITSHIFPETSKDLRKMTVFEAEELIRVFKSKDKIDVSTAMVELLAL
jgi:hypothetical protein